MFFRHDCKSKRCTHHQLKREKDSSFQLPQVYYFKPFLFAMMVVSPFMTTDAFVQFAESGEGSIVIFGLYLIASVS
jgi:hypothetical protein